MFNINSFLYLFVVTSYFYICLSFYFYLSLSFLQPSFITHTLSLFTMYSFTPSLRILFCYFLALFLLFSFFLFFLLLPRFIFFLLSFPTPPSFFLFLFLLLPHPPFSFLFLFLILPPFSSIPLPLLPSFTYSFPFPPLLHIPLHQSPLEDDCQPPQNCQSNPIDMIS